MRRREAATVTRSRRRMNWSGWRRVIGRHCWVRGGVLREICWAPTFTGRKYTEYPRDYHVARANDAAFRRPMSTISMPMSSCTPVKLFLLSRVGPSALTLCHYTTTRHTRHLLKNRTPEPPKTSKHAFFFFAHHSHLSTTPTAHHVDQHSRNPFHNMCKSDNANIH